MLFYKFLTELEVQLAKIEDNIAIEEFKAKNKLTKEKIIEYLKQGSNFNIQKVIFRYIDKIIIFDDKIKIYYNFKKFRTTSELVVCTTPRRGFYRLAHKRAPKFSNASLLLAAAMSRLSFFAYLFFIPVNGSIYSLIVIWSIWRSSSNWVCMYSAIILSFFPTEST